MGVGSNPTSDINLFFEFHHIGGQDGTIQLLTMSLVPIAEWRSGSVLGP